MTIIEQRRTLLATTGLALLLLLGGCGRLEVASSPDTFPVPDTAASGLRYDGQGVGLENFYSGPTVVSVSEIATGVDADLHQYTQTAITLLDEEFRNYINK